MNKKISALTALGATPAVGDIIPITDVSDTTDLDIVSYIIVVWLYRAIEVLIFRSAIPAE